MLNLMSIHIKFLFQRTHSSGVKQIWQYTLFWELTLNLDIQDIYQNNYIQDIYTRIILYFLKYIGVFLKHFYSEKELQYLN